MFNIYYNKVNILSIASCEQIVNLEKSIKLFNMKQEDGTVADPPKDKAAIALALKIYREQCCFSQKQHKDYSLSEIKKATGVSKSTIYRYK
ncbi:MAG: hypothetical protein A2Y17_04500 [Clostridiales bacterium GWF2_38_85]|nr:MAG: hypothetical protein A2Y17_04500 [Clostridiales bacterium GWF2_38_85]HBL85432.1 hypothetical protein [Clostridiales bacterium]